MYHKVSDVCGGWWGGVVNGERETVSNFKMSGDTGKEREGQSDRQ